MASTDKKVKSQKKARNIAEFKKSKKKWEDRWIADASDVERRLKDDLWLQDRSPENFPGFDQAKRIRGGLKGGGISQRGLGRAFKKGGKA